MKTSITQKNRQRIKDLARSLLVDFWKSYQEICGIEPSSNNFFPVQVDLIASRILQIDFLEPEEITPAVNNQLNIGTNEIAGYISRSENKIVVAQKYKTDWRRFTAAHEVGHWLLHPNLDRLRERPLMGGERADFSRPKEEQEADIFASELLMPAKFLTQCFIQIFRKPIEIKGNGNSPWVHVLASEFFMDELELLEKGVRFQALKIAQMSSLKGEKFISLSNRFGISATAMAIQLEELGLIR